MDAPAGREHYIPIPRGELVDLLASQPALEGEDRLLFRQFCELLSAGYHFCYHKVLEELKEQYAYFDPDSPAPPSRTLSEAERAEKLQQLFDRFGSLMQRANFLKLTKADIIEAGKAVSDWGLNMDVDFTVFERLEMY